MELNDEELKDFRDRTLQAATYGHAIGVAELYVEALAAEVGHSDVPAGAAPESAAHLLALATEALELRAHGKKPKRSSKKTGEVNPAKSEPPHPLPEEPKAEVPPPLPEEPKAEEAEVPAEPKPEEPAAEENEAEDELEEESEETGESPEESVNATTGSVAPKKAKKKAKKH